MLRIPPRTGVVPLELFPEVPQAASPRLIVAATARIPTLRLIIDLLVGE